MVQRRCSMCRPGLTSFYKGDHAKQRLARANSKGERGPIADSKSEEQVAACLSGFNRSAVCILHSYPAIGMKRICHHIQ